MSHLSATTCQDVPSLGRESVCVCVCMCVWCVCVHVCVRVQVRAHIFVVFNAFLCVYFLPSLLNKI